jgi:hypothetical protein
VVVNTPIVPAARSLARRRAQRWLKQLRRFIPGGIAPVVSFSGPAYGINGVNQLALGESGFTTLAAGVSGVEVLAAGANGLELLAAGVAGIDDLGGSVAGID